jgi:hypothetical protein
MIPMKIEGKCQRCGKLLQFEIPELLRGAALVGGLCSNCMDHDFNEQGGAVLKLKKELDNARFPLGKINLTPGVIAALEESGQHVFPFLVRHVRGDWGTFGQCDRIEMTEEEMQRGWDVTDETGKINKSNLHHLSDSVLSEYSTDRGKTIWVLTRLDFDGGTTVLLPDEN